MKRLSEERTRVLLKYGDKAKANDRSRSIGELLNTRLDELSLQIADN